MLTVGELTRTGSRARSSRPSGTSGSSGEVGNLRRQSSGHVYFGLKDADASVDAVLWASTARKVRFDLRDGTEVVARGRIEIYAPRGRYQLVVQEVEPRGRGRPGAGAAAAQGEARRRGAPRPGAQAAAALPARAHRRRDQHRPAPRCRTSCGCVHGRFPGAQVFVAGCRVQGEGAAATVISALRLLVDFGVDVAVVTRGGGSADDLWEFNDERLARSIAACPVPVVSAVGHEVDVTVADLVADVRAATPTHAAEVVVPVRDDLRGLAAALRGRLVRAEGNALGAAAARAAGAAGRARRPAPRPLRPAPPARRPRAPRGGRCRVRLRAERARVARAPRPCGGASPARCSGSFAGGGTPPGAAAAWSAATFRRESMRLAGLAARLEPANVAKILSRGFALALADGRAPPAQRRGRARRPRAGGAGGGVARRPRRVHATPCPTRFPGAPRPRRMRHRVWP